MRKNVIMIACDGLTYNMVNSSENHCAPMKFVESLKGNSIWCTNAYSQGPYTESATMGLLHGKMPLENGGYFVEHLRWEDSIFRVYKEAGYDLFTSYVASFIPPEILINGDYSYNIFHANPMYSRYLRNKLDYYLPIWKNACFTKTDQKLVKRLLNRHFESIFMLYSEEARCNDNTGLITPYETSDDIRAKRVHEGLKRLQLEYDAFKRNPDSFIRNIFEHYDTSYLLNECNWEAAPYSERIIEQKKWIANNYRGLFNKIKIRNRQLYLRNNLSNKKNVVNHLELFLNRGTMRKGGEFFIRLYQSIFKLDISKMIGTDLQQINTSAGGFVDQFIAWREKRTSTNPYFAYFHLYEFHRPLSFITHESLDFDRLEEELKVVSNYVDGLPEDYKGNIAFDLAAQYLDIHIERLFDYLKDKNELEKTIIVITADHGSSNCGETNRFTLTNHFFAEQYHIPAVIYGAGSHKITGFVNGADIPATLLQLSSIEKPNDWCGCSMLEKTREYTTVEYAGSGVPDISRKPVLFGYRDLEKSCVVSGYISKSQSISEMRLLEYYNLTEDPFEIENIANKLSKAKEKECKELFFGRISALRENYETYIKSL